VSTAVPPTPPTGVAPALGERVGAPPTDVGAAPSTSRRPAPTTSERLVSLDVFRGLTIAGMLLVNNPGSWGAIYPPLQHAAWNGWTPTDLIFPFFLFIVGITTYLSLAARRARGASDAELVAQIVRRGGLIFLLGFLLSVFPFYQWGPPASWGFAGEARPSDPTFWERIAWRWEHVRILGVLQRIGLVYILAALLTLRTTLLQQVLIVAALLYGYWFVMTLLPGPGEGLGAIVGGVPSETLAAHVDRWALGEKHIWQGSKTWDPEGLLSTFPAVGTAMLGVLAGRWIARRERPLAERIAALFAVGSLGMMVGLVWGWSFPINKGLWTSSYVVFTAGMACVVLATCLWLIDAMRITWWTKPWVIYGVNPIVAFVGSGLMARLIYSIIQVRYEGRPMSLQAALYQSTFRDTLGLSPINASLAFAIAFVLLWLGILWVLYRRRIFVKV
jgi:predicted acyltransferase